MKQAQMSQTEFEFPLTQAEEDEIIRFDKEEQYWQDYIMDLEIAISEIWG